MQLQRRMWIAGPHAQQVVQDLVQAAQDRLRGPLVRWRHQAGRVELQLELPGVDPADIAIDAKGNELWVRATRPTLTDADREGWSHPQAEGNIERRFELGEQADLERIEAHLVHGVLTVVVPEKTVVVPERSVPIQVAASRSN